MSGKIDCHTFIIGLLNPFKLEIYELGYTHAHAHAHAHMHTRTHIKGVAWGFITEIQHCLLLLCPNYLLLNSNTVMQSITMQA